jgi:hypothetical protein
MAGSDANSGTAAMGPLPELFFNAFSLLWSSEAGVAMNFLTETIARHSV